MQWRQAGALLTVLCAGVPHPTFGESDVSPVTRDTLGTMSDGRAVDRFTLTNGNGTILRTIALGATATELHVRDREGALRRRPARVRHGRRVRGQPPLHGLHHRPRCQPHQRGAVRSRRGDLPAGPQLRRAPSARRGGRPAPEALERRGRRPRRRPGGPLYLSQPGRRGGVPGQPVDGGYLRAYRGGRHAHRVRGDHRQGDPRQPHQPQLLQPVRGGGRGGHLRPRAGHPRGHDDGAGGRKGSRPGRSSRSPAPPSTSPARSGSAPTSTGSRSTTTTTTSSITAAAKRRRSPPKRSTRPAAG